MRLLHLLPKFMHRHKFIEILCKTGLHKKTDQIFFNNASSAIINLLDPEPRNVFIKGEFEPDFFHIAKSFLPEEGTFFDLGANVGFCSFGLCVDRPNAHYHLFEANLQLIHLLKQSVELYPHQKIYLNHACISDQAGTSYFQVESNQSGQSHVSTKDGKGIVVSNLKLDEYCDDISTNFIDFTKIDLEGHELPALHGWRKYLSAHRIKAIYIEIMPENQARYGRLTNAPLSFLESLGYELYLCKKEDFGFFGDDPSETKFLNKSLELSRFCAQEFPQNFATDILALTPS